MPKVPYVSTGVLGWRPRGIFCKEYSLPSSYFFLLPCSPQGFPERGTRRFASLFHFSSLISPTLLLPCVRPDCAPVSNPSGKVLQRSLINKRSRTPAAPPALSLAAILRAFPDGSYAIALITFLQQHPVSLLLPLALLLLNTHLSCFVSMPFLGNLSHMSA